MTSIKKETVQFLIDLKKNNDRDWFEANKEKFVSANQNFIEFTGALIPEVSKFDKSVGALNAKDCVFRIYRDTRFAKDKSPYKTNFGVHLMPGGKQSGKAGYYFHFQPGSSWLGGGLHLPEPKVLKAVREEISYNAKQFLKIINDKNFKSLFTIEGEKLAKVPQGFDKEDPMGEYLKYKELIIKHTVDDKTILSSDFTTYCAKVFKAITPFNTFVNNATTEAK
jgi:uncharacterized protein (TIGR02453 family)